VAIYDTAENAWLNETFAGLGAFWTGLSDEASEGTWGLGQRRADKLHQLGQQRTEFLNQL
jgi:hypothetical protein